ncbi:MAG: hypothetical protein NTZ67_02380 [Gammaproteobacteria bacterium]|nr:hypothetical protein [Gammaproteobacteria bacterium]
MLGAIPEQGQEIIMGNENKVCVSQRFLEMLVSSRSALLTGGLTAIAATSSSDAMTSDDIARAQTILATFYGALGLIAIFSSFIVRHFSEDPMYQESAYKNLTGKRFELSASCLFSLIGAILNYSQLGATADQKNKYVMGFSALFWILSGYFISPDASRTQATGTAARITEQPDGTILFSPSRRRSILPSAGSMRAPTTHEPAEEAVEATADHSREGDEDDSTLPRLQAVNFPGMIRR